MPDNPAAILLVAACAFLAAFMIFIRLASKKMAKNYYQHILLSRGDEAEVVVDIAKLWIRVLEVESDWARIQFKFFRQNQLLDAGDLTLDFDGDTGKSMPIFPGPDYPHKSAFSAKLLLKPRSRTINVVLSRQIERSLLPGGPGFGW